MPLFITILMMCTLGGAEIDIFVPSFPDLQRTFGLSPFMVELTLGVNLVAHCLTSLLVGNLGDRYGRRPLILIGLVIFIIGSLFCTFATAYWQLLGGVFFKASGYQARLFYPMSLLQTFILLKNSNN
jgi:DHA1 family bicyclomycin/chloramphenicol resistance-like MFS transporter